MRVVLYTFPLVDPSFPPNVTSPSYVRLNSEPFRAGFPNRNRNRFVPVTPNMWPICDICDGHKLSQIWICDGICFSTFFLVFLAKQVLSHLVTNVTNGHTFNCDWYKPVSVPVSIEMVRNERNTEKHTREWAALFLFSVLNLARNGSKDTFKGTICRFLKVVLQVELEICFPGAGAPSP